MVDPLMRRRYARLLRALATGRLTNFDYEEAVEKTIDGRQDPAISEIYKLAWHLYDDLHEHRLKGRNALTREGRREVAKWLLFLYSDLEYSETKFKKNREVWPFKNKGELVDQKSRPVPFFCGEESYPDGIAPFETRHLTEQEIEEPRWGKGSTIASILAVLLWMLWKWYSQGFSLKVLPLILGIGLSVPLILSRSFTYVPLKWWQVPLALIGIFGWIWILVYFSMRLGW